MLLTLVVLAHSAYTRSKMICLRRYRSAILPDGAELTDSVEDEFYAEYEYDVGGTQYIDILIFPVGQQVYVDTEGAEIQPLQVGDLEGYWFSKDTLRYVCFEMDGCQFSVCGTVDIEKLIKVASSVAKK